LVRQRPNESLGLMRQALLLAEETGDERGVMRACMNLSYLLSLSGRNREAEEVIERGIALARRRGDRAWERSLTTNLVGTYHLSGRWDDVERVVDALPDEGRIASNPVQASTMLEVATIALRRGDNERVRELAVEYASWEETANRQAAGVRIWARTLLAQAEARDDDALAECLGALRDRSLSSQPEAVDVFLELGCESALATGLADALADLISLAEAAPIDRSPSLEAHLELQRARLAALRGEDEPPFEAAVTALREVDEPFWVANALLEHAEWLAVRGRVDEAGPLVAAARETFERLRVPPKLERVARLEARSAASATEAPTHG
jgi:hypothetical protein